jgi:hypothetical protein
MSLNPAVSTEKYCALSPHYCLLQSNNSPLECGLFQIPYTVSSSHGRVFPSSLSVATVPAITKAHRLLPSIPVATMSH